MPQMPCAQTDPDMSLHSIIPPLPYPERLFPNMRTNFNFNPHTLIAQSRNSNTRPYRLMVRHPLLKFTPHLRDNFVVQNRVVAVNAEDLFPTLGGACVAQRDVDVFESLFDLCGCRRSGGEGAGGGIPAAYRAMGEGVSEGGGGGGGGG